MIPTGIRVYIMIRWSACIKLGWCCGSRLHYCTCSSALKLYVNIVCCYCFFLSNICFLVQCCFWLQPSTSSIVDLASQLLVNCIESSNMPTRLRETYAKYTCCAMIQSSIASSQHHSIKNHAPPNPH